MAAKPDWQRADDVLEKRLNKAIADLELKIEKVQKLGNVLEVGSKVTGSSGGMTVVSKAPEGATAALIDIRPTVVPGAGGLTMSAGGSGLIFPDDQQVGFGAATVRMNSKGGGISMWSQSPLPISWIFIKATRNDGVKAAALRSRDKKR